MSVCERLETGHYLRKGGGGYKTRVGGGVHVKFYLYEKGGRKSFSHADGGGGGGAKAFGVVFMR